MDSFINKLLYNVYLLADNFVKRNYKRKQIFQVLGPRFMENRKPYELKNCLVLYNLFQVLFSSWLFYEVSFEYFFTFY